MTDQKKEKAVNLNIRKILIIFGIVLAVVQVIRMVRQGTFREESDLAHSALTGHTLERKFHDAYTCYVMDKSNGAYSQAGFPFTVTSQSESVVQLELHVPIKDKAGRKNGGRVDTTISFDPITGLGHYTKVTSYYKPLPAIRLWIQIGEPRREVIDTSTEVGTVLMERDSTGKDFTLAFRSNGGSSAYTARFVKPSEM